MKKIVLLFLALFPALSFAQNFEIGLNGGVNFHFLPIANWYARQDKPIAGYAVAFKGTLLFPHGQIGVGLEAVNLSQWNYPAYKYDIKVHNDIAKPLVTPYAFYNYRYIVSTGYLYAGLMAGAAIARVGVNTLHYDSSQALTGYSTTYNTVSGYVAGAQLGAVIYPFKGIGFNLEGGLRFSGFSYKQPGSTLPDNPYSYRLFYIPITAGIRIKI